MRLWRMWRTNCAHPLTVIKGTIETLEDGAMDDLTGRGPLLISMQRETDRLIRLVNDLLILTRADAGMLQLELESVDLGNLAQQRCAHLAPLAASRGVTFEVTGRRSALGSGRMKTAWHRCWITCWIMPGVTARKVKS